MSLNKTPKADMHVHLEGTITPEMVLTLSEKNKVEIPKGLIKNGNYSWDEDGTAAGSLKGFVNAYDDATSVMKTAQDYVDITYDYLMRSAAEGCIYCEIGISADHGKMVGLNYLEMLAAIESGYQKAKKETDIEMRLISTCVRHFGVDSTLRVAEITRDNPHHLVTAFGIAGDENAHSFVDFKAAFDISNMPHRTAHAGEAAGPESVRGALEILNVSRFGHMVRAIEDEELLERLRIHGAVPEVCVSSNLVLKVYPDYSSHPLRKLFDFGLNVTLGSDDPTFFNTSIGREYQIAQEEFGFSDDELLQITQNAIESAFIDATTRELLLKKVR